MVPATATLILVFAATRFQPALRRAFHVDQMLVAGDIEQAIATMETWGETAFPPAWDPPPRFNQRSGQRPEVGALVRALKANEPQAWVSDRLMVQADEILLQQYGWGMGAKHLSVERGGVIYLNSASLRKLIEDLESTVRLPLSDRELSESLRNVLEVARQSLEHAIANEAARETWAADQKQDEMPLTDSPD